MPTRILHVAVFSENSTNVWQAKGFEDLGCDVTKYDYRERVKHIGKEARDIEIRYLCEKAKPDITLFAKCNNMDAKVLAYCKKFSTVVLWMPDDRNNINVEFVDKMHQADHIFGSNYDVIDAGKIIGRDVQQLAGGFDPDLYRSVDTPYKWNVSFIGSLHNAERKEYTKYVAIEVISGVFGLTHSSVVNASRINLNFTLGAGTSNRAYKILAAGGFLLTQPWHNMPFTPGQDLDTFCTPYELTQKVNYYLENADARKAIARNGQHAVQKYDHVNYAKRILEVL